jgi:hypothetical protein
MALIEGANGKLLSGVETTCLGMPVVVKRRDVNKSYIGTFRTGTLPAALAANSIIAGMRNGLFSNVRAYITQIDVEFIAITAASAAAACQFSLLRYSVANIQQQGTLLTTLGLMRRDAEDVPTPWGAIQTVASSAFAPTGPQGGQLTVATTAGLTTTGVTLDTATESPFFFFNTTTTTPAILERIKLTTTNELGMEHPIELAPGEGLAIRSTTVWPTGLTAVVLIRVHWMEV